MYKAKTKKCILQLYLRKLLVNCFLTCPALCEEAPSESKIFLPFSYMEQSLLEQN